MLTERQRKIVEFLKRTPDFITMRHLVLSFRSILRRGRVATLKRWIREAENAGIAAISRFVGQLKRDQRAVENAVAYGWSNGPVERTHQSVESSEAANVRTSWIRAASLTDSALGGLSNRCTKPEEEPI